MSDEINVITDFYIPLQIQEDAYSNKKYKLLKENNVDTAELIGLKKDANSGVIELGEEKEGSVLQARTDSLSDDDGIASIDVAWERSRDGRNWVSLTGENTKKLNLDQTVVGSQVRVKATLVDRFGVETVLHSQPTRIIENVNNVPSGNVLIRRVSN